MVHHQLKKMDQEYALLNADDLSAEKIRDLIESKKASVKVFQYHISFIAISLFRLSPAFLIRKEEDQRRFQKKYNLISLFFGPWFFPKGPFRVYKDIRANSAGGIDVTKDVLLNLDNYNPESGKIVISEIHTIFKKLPKADFKEISKALSGNFKAMGDARNIFAGYFINSGDYEPHMVVGLSTDLNLTTLEPIILKLLYKRFMPHVPFEIITSSSHPELFVKLVEQGSSIKRANTIVT